MTDEKLEELNILSNSIKVRKKALTSLELSKTVGKPCVTVMLTSGGSSFREDFTISGELAEELINVITDREYKMPVLPMQDECKWEEDVAEIRKQLLEEQYGREKDIR